MYQINLNSYHLEPKNKLMFPYHKAIKMLFGDIIMFVLKIYKVNVNPLRNQ